MSRPAAGPRHGASTTRRGTRRGVRARARHASDLGEGFVRFLAVTGLALLPGAGLLAAGRRRAGAVLLGLVVVVAAVGAYLLVSRKALTTALDLAVRPDLLLAAAVAVALVGLGWCASILLTAQGARPQRMSGGQRVLAGVFVGTLCLAVVAPSAVAARYALIQRGVVQTLFADIPGAEPRPGVAAPRRGEDPWASTPRVNMLLLGSDAGKSRTGVRTDSMMVVSIDTRTGKATLFSLPRNLQNAPIPESNPLHEVWPNGFNCGSECLLNSVWLQAEEYRDRFPGDTNPGLTTTRDVIGEVLGLRIDYYTIIDLSGFEGLVNAMGGVEVNVPRRIPIGGGKSLSGRQMPINGYIEPGVRRLDGYRALWFARSREGSDDYDRMRRQRCLVGALLNQSDPGTMLARYPQLAKVLTDNVQTDVPQRDLPAWVDLIERVQKGGITSLPFTNDVIVPADPDFDRIKELVKRATSAPVRTQKPATTPSETQGPSTPADRPTTTPSPTAPDEAEASTDLKAVC